MLMMRGMGLVALVHMVICLVPLGFGLLYAVRPTEQRLALMRPLSLAAIFAAISGTASGVMSGLRYMALSGRPVQSDAVLIGFAESVVPIFFGFGCLMVAWLCVAFGLWRRP